MKLGSVKVSSLLLTAIIFSQNGMAGNTPENLPEGILYRNPTAEQTRNPADLDKITGQFAQRNFIFIPSEGKGVTPLLWTDGIYLGQNGAQSAFVKFNLEVNDPGIYGKAFQVAGGLVYHNVTSHGATYAIFMQNCNSDDTLALFKDVDRALEAKYSAQAGIFTYAQGVVSQIIPSAEAQSMPHCAVPSNTDALASLQKLQDIASGLTAYSANCKEGLLMGLHNQTSGAVEWVRSGDAWKDVIHTKDELVKAIDNWDVVLGELKSTVKSTAGLENQDPAVRTEIACSNIFLPLGEVAGVGAMGVIQRYRIGMMVGDNAAALGRKIHNTTLERIGRSIHAESALALMGKGKLGPDSLDAKMAQLEGLQAKTDAKVDALTKANGDRPADPQARSSQDVKLAKAMQDKAKMDAKVESLQAKLEKAKIQNVVARERRSFGSDGKLLSDDVTQEELNLREAYMGKFKQYRDQAAAARKHLDEVKGGSQKEIAEANVAVQSAVNNELQSKIELFEAESTRAKSAGKTIPGLNDRLADLKIALVDAQARLASIKARDFAAKGEPNNAATAEKESQALLNLSNQLKGTKDPASVDRKVLAYARANTFHYPVEKEGASRSIASVMPPEVASDLEKLKNKYPKLKAGNSDEDNAKIDEVIANALIRKADASDQRGFEQLAVGQNLGAMAHDQQASHSQDVQDVDAAVKRAIDKCEGQE
jgi:hypothetical protein